MIDILRYLFFKPFLYYLKTFSVPQGAPTFTRKPQILQKTSDSGDPAIVFDIGFQADQNPEVRQFFFSCSA